MINTQLCLNVFICCCLISFELFRLFSGNNADVYCTRVKYLIIQFSFT